MKTLLISFAAVALMGSTAMAVNPNDVWIGGGASDNWSDPNNWWDNSSPLSGTDLIFAGSTRLTPNNDYAPGASMNSITFESGAGAFTLGGNYLGFFNDAPNSITNNSTSLQTISFSDTAGNSGLTLGGFGGTIDAASGDINVMSNVAIITFSGATFLTVTGSHNTDISGTINEDSGLASGLIKEGTGTLTLGAANSYTGGTTIHNGTVIVDNADALGAEEDNIFAVTHNDVLLDGGTLRTAEGSPRVFRAPDNYTQTSGTLFMQIGGLASGVESDQMQVGRSANLSSELFLHQINGFTPTPGDTVRIITTNNGTTPDFDGRPPGLVNGEFDEVNSDFQGLIQPTAVYGTDFVDVVFELGSFAGLEGLNRNEFCVAENLDDVAASSGFLSRPRAVELITFVGNLPIDDLPLAFDLISPDEYASAYTISFAHATVQNMNLQRHLDAVRAGAGGYCPPSVEVQPMGKDAIQDKNVASDKYVAPTAMEMPECRWSFWATGTGQWVGVDGQNHDGNDANDDEFGRKAYDIATGGFIGGADYRINKHFAVGISGAFSSGEADFGGKIGHTSLDDHANVQVDGGKIGGYLTAFSGGFYVDVAGSIGWNNYDLRRSGLVDDGGFISTESVHGNTEGVEWNGLIGTGYDFHWGCLNIGPTATFQITHVELDGFTEDDSNIANLHFPDQDETSSRLSLGGKAEWDWHLGHTIIRPELRAAWLHEFDSTAYHIRWAFDNDIAGDDRHFCNVFGPSLGGDSAQLGAGFSVQFTRCLALYAAYDGVFGPNYESHSGSGGIRFGF